MGDPLNRFFFGIATRFVTTVFVLSSLSPLIHQVMQITPSGRTLSGTCSGNCANDGCSPANQKARTCCCWQKRQPSRPVTRDCCQKNDQIPLSQLQPSTQPTPRNELVYKCGGPCGEKEACSLSAPEWEIILPAPCSTRILSALIKTPYLCSTFPFHSRPNKPPEPPPPDSTCQTS